MKYIYFLAIILVVTANAQTLNLDDCISYGEENSLDVRKKTLEQELDLPAGLAAWGQFLPSITVSYGVSQYSSRVKTYVADDGRVIELPILLPTGEEIPVMERKSRSSFYTININEVFFNGGRNYFNLKNSNLSKESRDFNLEAAKTSLRAAITQNYCAVYASQELLELYNEIIKQRRRQLDFAEVRFETGTATRRDVLQAEVEIGRAKNDSAAAALDLNRALKNMNLLIGFSVDSVYRVKDLPPVFNPDWDGDSMIGYALRHNSNYKSAGVNVKILKNDNKAAYGDYLPNIMGSYSYSRTEQSGANRDFTLDPRNKSSSLNLSVSWNLFDRFTRSLRLQDSKVKLQQAKIALDELKRSIRQEIQLTIVNLKSIFGQYEVAEQNIELARENLKFEEERYRLGNATTIDRGFAEISYIQARLDAIRLESDFYGALARLEEITGKNLRDSE